MKKKNDYELTFNGGNAKTIKYQIYTKSYNYINVKYLFNKSVRKLSSSLRRSAIVEVCGLRANSIPTTIEDLVKLIMMLFGIFF